MSAPTLVRPFPLRSRGDKLDGCLHRPGGRPRGAAVLAHPHPAHGGHMDHPVVVAAAERGAVAGLAGVRFDFAGVRRSEGDVQDGDGHLANVRSAAREARTRTAGGPLLGAGFSYGARMLARAVSEPEEDAEAHAPSFAGLLLLAPATKVPRTARDFGNLLLGRPLREAARDAPAVASLGRIEIPTVVVVGTRDVVAPPEELAAALPGHVRLEVLDGLNHFFSRGQGAGTTAFDVLEPALDRAWQELLERLT